MLDDQDDSFNKVNELLKTIEKLNHVNDIDSLLDTILYEARLFSNADAGSIFLKKDDQLEFSYVQNDSLSKKDKNSNKYIYSTFSIPINEKSIAGYVALKGKSLIIDDVYKINRGSPYSFNKEFDKISAYRTMSMLTVPLKMNKSEVVGVIQILNKLDDKSNAIPFSSDDERYVSFFANSASIAVEKAKITREIILRMIKMAELRDPKETGAHVNRVASYAIEIYHKWAEARKISEAKIKKQKDIIRIAAMLHDVGKIAISDNILKKKSSLTKKEYEIMKGHVGHGKKLFNSAMTDFDKMAGEIAYSHHERWDGKGYPKGLKGEEIPIAGRITALADVYDALISIRSYKSAWDESEVLGYLKNESGKHFDPELIDIFLSIYDIIKAIRQKFPDEK